MWNSWKKLAHITPFQRLLIALILSFVLHLFLLGKLDFSLPDLNEDHQLIEAELVEIKPGVPPKLTEENKPVQPSPIKESVSQSVPVEPEVEQEPITPNAPEAMADSKATSNDIAVKSNEPTVEPPQLDQPDEASFTINPNAYQYVETEFDVRTELDAKVDASPAGKAKMVYELLSNGEQYRLKSLIQAKGLLALFMPDLLQTSEGFLTSLGLQPQHYLYQFGDKKNKTFSADFDWESRKLQLRSEKGVSKVELLDGTQDLLSFMYQFMFVPPLENMHLSITNGKKLVAYDYGFEGEEIITTKLGNLSTIHLIRRTDEGDEKTELWLALDYQYVPVKIRKTEKDGRVYELLVTSLKTERPVSPNE